MSRLSIISRPDKNRRKQVAPTPMTRPGGGWTRGSMVQVMDGLDYKSKSLDMPGSKLAGGVGMPGTMDTSHVIGVLALSCCLSEWGRQMWHDVFFLLHYNESNWGTGAHRASDLLRETRKLLVKLNISPTVIQIVSYYFHVHVVLHIAYDILLFKLKWKLGYMYLELNLASPAPCLYFTWII